MCGNETLVGTRGLSIRGTSCQYFGLEIFALNQYLGFVKNNIEKIQYLLYTNLKKGRIMPFGAIHYSYPLNKFSSAYNKP